MPLPYPPDSEAAGPAAWNALKETGLYVLFDPRTRAHWQDDLSTMHEVGARWFQLRMKGAPLTAVRAAVAAARAALGPETALIVNDDPQLALAADGVHVGPGDAAPAAARAVVGAGRIVGSSGNDATRLTGPAAAAADYFGVGAFRATSSKPSATAALGAAGLRRAVVLAGGKPVVAIGGLTPADALVVRDAGAVAMAVLAGIWGAADPAMAAELYLDAWREAAA